MHYVREIELTVIKGLTRAFIGAGPLQCLTGWHHPAAPGGCLCAYTGLTACGTFSQFHVTIYQV
jgi:hypothetical protein